MAPNRTEVGPYIGPGTRTVKLQYIPKYRVLLCVQCGYCVLKRALDRHLKTIHHLPAAERKVHINGVHHLDIADLEDIPYPGVETEPILGLPIFDGYSCDAEDCSYLCVTNKRMQAHWRSEHPSQTNLHCHRVQLQTFFKGNSLRYFKVIPLTLADRKEKSIASTKPEILPMTTVSSGDANELIVRSEPVTGAPFKNESIKAFVDLPPADFNLSLISDLPPPDDSFETMVEWLLTRQFCEENYLALQPVKGSAASWRDEMLQACTQADFLRFAVLSLSANQVAFANPDAQDFYGKEASRYRDLAIAALANRVSTVTTDNFFEVFNFTRLITLCCLAGLQLKKIEGEVEADTTKSVLPVWFPIQRYGKELVWPFRGDGRIIRAMHGPVGPLVASNLMPSFDIDNNPYDWKILELQLALAALPQGIVDPSCSEALDILRRVWATPYRDQGNSFRDIALMWPTRVAVEYFELVESHDPVALVIIAYYWVLWSFSEEHYWYMKGHAETMLLRVVQNLDVTWQHWIEWPISIIFGADFTDDSGEST